MLMTLTWRLWRRCACVAAGWFNFLGNAAGDASFASFWAQILSAAIIAAGGPTLSRGAITGISIGVCTCVRVVCVACDGGSRRWCGRAVLRRCPWLVFVASADWFVFEWVLASWFIVRGCWSCEGVTVLEWSLVRTQVACCGVWS